MTAIILTFTALEMRRCKVKPPKNYLYDLERTHHKQPHQGNQGSPLCIALDITR